jgi:hypothetical protein
VGDKGAWQSMWRVTRTQCRRIARDAVHEGVVMAGVVMEYG